ncbi:MAG: tetratricopeptide repeat protein [Bdellovibrionales bacterium]|nr:tetratricopeptide repeat protein [Bdellovibrionales bacterium]
MRTLKFSLLSILLTVISCSQMSVAPNGVADAGVNGNSKLIDFNPVRDLGIKGEELQEMVESAKASGEKATEFLATDLFIKGNDASMRGDFQTAARIFRAVSELRPDDAYIKRKFAYELIRSGELKESEKMLEAAFRKSGSMDESVGLILASLYTSLDKHKDARLTYQRLLSLNPDAEEACLYLSRSYVAEKLYKEAHSLLASCERRATDNPVFTFFRGRIEYDRGNKPKALEYFQKSLKIDSSYAQAALAIGALYEEKENFQAALKVYKKFIDEEGNGSNTQVLSRLVTILFSLDKNADVIPYAETLSSLDGSDLNLKVRLGLLYSDVERYDEAAKLFQDVLEAVPESDKVLYYLGALNQQTNKPNEAILYFKRINNSSPLYGDAGVQISQLLGGLARESFVQGKVEKSNEFNSFVEKRVQDSPDMAMELRMLQASFFEDTFQFKNAITTLTSMKTHKNFTESHSYYLASILEKDGQFPEARKIVQVIIDKDPNNAHALNFLGYSYLERNEKLDKAYEYISKAVALKPEDGYIRDSLAWYFYQTGKFKEALSESKKAFELVKGDPTITKHLGMIYQRLRYYDKAKQYLTEALKSAQAQSEREDVLKLLEDVEKSRLPASTNP